MNAQHLCVLAALAYGQNVRYMIVSWDTRGLRFSHLVTELMRSSKVLIDDSYACNIKSSNLTPVWLYSIYLKFFWAPHWAQFLQTNNFERLLLQQHNNPMIMMDVNKIELLLHTISVFHLSFTTKTQSNAENIRHPPSITQVLKSEIALNFAKRWLAR